MTLEIDRYPLPPDDDRQLPEQPRSLERRIAELEGRNPTAAGSIVRSGRFTVATADGDPLVELGTIDIPALIGDSTVDEGIRVQDQAGRVLFLATRTHGQVYPLRQVEWRVPAQSTAVTSGTFSTVYQAVPSRWPSDAFRFTGAVQTPAGTEGEVQLEVVGPGGSPTFTTAVLPIPESTDGYAIFEVDLAANGIEINDAFFVNLQARRTTGSGDVSVFEPLPLESWDTQILGASVDGDPSIF